MNTSQSGVAARFWVRWRIRWIQWVVGAVLAWGFAGGAAIAQQTAQCQLRGTFTGAASGNAFANSTAQPNCNSFALTWNIGDPATAITALSIQLEGSDDGTTWTAYTGASTVIVGTNPSTALSGAIKVTPSTKLAFVRVKVTSFTGSGTISYQLYGYSGTSAGVGGSAGGGGSCGALGGDVTGTCTANTVVQVEGAAIPVSAVALATNASKQLIAASNTGTGSVVVLNNGPTLIAPFASNATLTGVPIAPTATPGTNTTQVATTAFVQAASTGGTVTSVYGNAGPAIVALAPTGTNTFDASGMTSANGDKVPVIAGAAPSQNGAIAYDSTLNNLHAAKSSADSVITQTTATSAGNGNCVNWINSAGSLKLGDTGAPCGSSGGSGGGVLTYSGPTLSILSGTAFCPVGGGGACSATETNVDIDSSAVSTVSNMYAQLSTALGAGNSVAITWRKNASSQTVTCTISGAVATACNDTTHSFAVAQADLLDYQMVFTGTIIVTPTITIMSQFGTVNAGVTSVSATAPITSSGGTTPVISATYQGNGAKVQASTGTTTTNDCVKFDANGNTVDAGAPCSATSGTVTSVGFTGGLISVANPTTTPAFTVAGTSGGIPYFSGAATWATSAALTAHGVVIGGGAATAPTSTTAGTSGQVLTSNGASSDPTFQTASSVTYSQPYIQFGGNSYDIQQDTPPTGSFSFINQGVGTATVLTGGAIHLTWQAVNADNLTAYVQNTPGATYTLIVHCRQGWGGGCGIALSDGTKAQVLAWLRSAGAIPEMLLENYTNPTTFSSTVFTSNLVTGFNPDMWLRLVEDGTHRTYSISQYNGEYQTVTQQTTNSFLTPTKIGIGTDTDAGFISPVPGDAMLLSWTLTTP